MNRPLKLHLKAALLCALAAAAVALLFLWVPFLPAWKGWRPPVQDARLDAVIAVLAAAWVAWCVVDIPRTGLKLLILGASLWLLGSGIWLAGLHGWPVCSFSPLVAAGLAGAAALGFSLSPAGSRRARWSEFVGSRLGDGHLRRRIEAADFDGAPRQTKVTVVEALWPTADDHPVEGWRAFEDLARRTTEHFQKAGAYLERIDGEGARFVFGCWGEDSQAEVAVLAAWDWTRSGGGCTALATGDCMVGVGRLPAGERWTIHGTPLRRAARMAAAARGYLAKVMVEDSVAAELRDLWVTRRISWWEFEGDRVLLREVRGLSAMQEVEETEALARWEKAWDCFWKGDWQEAESAFGALARERNDNVARVFALRSGAAQRGAAG